MEQKISIPGPGPLNEIGTPKPAIDWTRPVQTRGGMTVKIYAIDHGLKKPVVGSFGDSADATTWAYDGTFIHGRISTLDLENIPQTPTDAQILDMVEGKAVSL